MAIRIKPEKAYAIREDACRACQCHSCKQLQTCRIHRNLPQKGPSDTTPFPCRGCGAGGVYRPFVPRTPVAVCQLYMPPGRRNTP